MENLDELYNHTLDAIKLLTLPYERQKLFFEKDFVDVPFEVLDEYNILFCQLPNLIDDNRFSVQAVSYLIRLYCVIDVALNNLDKLKDINENTFDEVRERKWVRDMAKKCLNTIGVPPGDPQRKYF